MQHVIAESVGPREEDAPQADRPMGTGAAYRARETWDDMILNIRRHIAVHAQGLPAQLAADIVAPTLERNVRARFRELEK